MSTHTITCGRCGSPTGGTLTFPDSVPASEQAAKAASYLCASCAAIPAPANELTAAYTRFLSLCSTLGFDSKAGFTELNAVLADLFDDDPLLAARLSIELLGVNQEIIYRGGSWDDCPETLS